MLLSCDKHHPWQRTRDGRDGESPVAMVYELHYRTAIVLKICRFLRPLWWNALHEELIEALQFHFTHLMGNS